MAASVASVVALTTSIESTAALSAACLRHLDRRRPDRYRPVLHPGGPRPLVLILLAVVLSFLIVVALSPPAPLLGESRAAAGPAIADRATVGQATAGRATAGPGRSDRAGRATTRAERPHGQSDRRPSDRRPSDCGSNDHGPRDRCPPARAERHARPGSRAEDPGIWLVTWVRRGF